VGECIYVYANELVFYSYTHGRTIVCMCVCISNTLSFITNTL